MWLLPLGSLLAAAAAQIFYRLERVGGPPPSRGPLLLVANHPNSLVDAILVLAVASRPVRFLAKAPLFATRRLGWLLRAVGAIPVHRRVDDAEAMHRNVHAFASVFEALDDDSAIGIFPEGVSHSEPALARLKTGSARMALGFAERTGAAFPVVPVGIVLRAKAVFRSQALVVLGPPISWEDLATRGESDHHAVRELTARIDEALRRVTLNLERWEDEPLVRCAEEIWRAEVAETDDPEERLRRIHTTTEILATLRRRGDAGWTALARAVDNHGRRLERLRLTPTALRSRTDVATALRWTLRRLHLLGPVAWVIAAIGAVLYWPPYRLTAMLARLAPQLEDVTSTYKLLIGMAVYPLWTMVLAGSIWYAAGGWVALLVLAGAPLMGILGLWIRERWRGAWSDVRRFFTLRSRADLIDTLRARQAELASQLQRLYQAWLDGRVSPLTVGVTVPDSESFADEDLPDAAASRPPELNGTP